MTDKLSDSMKQRMAVLMFDCLTEVDTIHRMRLPDVLSAPALSRSINTLFITIQMARALRIRKDVYDLVRKHSEVHFLHLCSITPTHDQYADDEATKEMIGEVDHLADASAYLAKVMAK